MIHAAEHVAELTAEVSRLTAALAEAEAERDKARRLAAEGRAAGRAEAAAILLDQDAETWSGEWYQNGPAALVESHPCGIEGEYGTSWIPERVRELFDVAPDGGVMASLLDRMDGAFWEQAAHRDDAEFRALAAERALEGLSTTARELATVASQAYVLREGLPMMQLPALAAKVLHLLATPPNAPETAPETSKEDDKP